MGVNKRYLYVSEENMKNMDPFRKEIGSVWYNNNGLRFGKKISDRPFNITFGSTVSITSDQAPYSAKHQVVKVTANPKKFGLYPECMKCGWPEYIYKLINNTPWTYGLNPQEAIRLYLNPPGWMDENLRAFKDCFFALGVPLSKKEIQAIGSDSKFLIGEVEFEYNHYIKVYEEALKDLKIKELVMPNFYLSLLGEPTTEIIAVLKENARLRVLST